MDHVITLKDVLVVGGGLLGIVVVLSIMVALLSAIGGGFSR